MNEIYFDTVTNVTVTLNNLGVATNAEPVSGSHFDSVRRSCSTANTAYSKEATPLESQTFA